MGSLTAHRHQACQGHAWLPPPSKGSLPVHSTVHSEPFSKTRPHACTARNMRGAASACSCLVWQWVRGTTPFSPKSESASSFRSPLSGTYCKRTASALREGSLYLNSLGLFLARLLQIYSVLVRPRPLLLVDLNPIFDLCCILPSLTYLFTFYHHHGHGTNASILGRPRPASSWAGVAAPASTQLGFVAAFTGVSFSSPQRHRTITASRGWTRSIPILTTFSHIGG
jgi:hypothetical protein